MATRRSAERQGVRPVFALLPLSVPLVLAAATLSFSATDTVPVDFPPIRYDRIAATSLPLRNHSVLLPVESGDTLDRLIQNAGVERADALALVSELSRHVNPRKIKRGEFVRIEFGADDAVRSIGLTAGNDGRIDAVKRAGGFDDRADSRRRQDRVVVLRRARRVGREPRPRGPAHRDLRLGRRLLQAAQGRLVQRDRREAVLRRQADRLRT